MWEQQGDVQLGQDWVPQREGSSICVVERMLGT